MIIRPLEWVKPRIYCCFDFYDGPNTGLLKCGPWWYTYDYLTWEEHPQLPYHYYEVIRIPKLTKVMKDYLLEYRLKYPHLFYIEGKRVQFDNNFSRGKMTKSNPFNKIIKSKKWSKQ